MTCCASTSSSGTPVMYQPYSNVSPFLGMVNPMSMESSEHSSIPVSTGFSRIGDVCSSPFSSTVSAHEDQQSLLSHDQHSNPKKFKLDHHHASDQLYLPSPSPSSSAAATPFQHQSPASSSRSDSAHMRNTPPMGSSYPMMEMESIRHTSPPHYPPMSETASRHHHTPPYSDDSDRRQMQVLSDKVAINIFYDGDARSEVEEHFSRTTALLQQDYASLGRKATPLSERNLPASFWDPNYKRPFSSSDFYSSTSSSSSADLTGALHQLAASCAAADWSAYPHSQSAGYRTASSHYGYPARLQQTGANYWAAASRLVKAEWPSAAAAGSDYHHAVSALQHHHHHGDFSHHPYGSAAVAAAAAAAQAHHYSNMTGLEGTVQDASKELYWHSSF